MASGILRSTGTTVRSNALRSLIHRRSIAGPSSTRDRVRGGGTVRRTAVRLRPLFGPNWGRRLGLPRFGSPTFAQYGNLDPESPPPNSRASLTSPSESMARSSARRDANVTRIVGPSLADVRMTSTTSACTCGSGCIDPPPQNKSVVGSAKPEGGTHDGLESAGAPLVGDVIEVELGIGNEIDRGRDHLLTESSDADSRLDGGGRAQAVAECPFDRTDGKVLGMRPKDFLDHAGL